MEFNGDVAFLALRQYLASRKTVRVHWQCNAYAAYFGGSYLSHFPCSAGCSATIQLVNEVSEWLKREAPELGEQIHSFHIAPFWLKADRRVTLQEPADPADWTRFEAF